MEEVFGLLFLLVAFAIWLLFAGGCMAIANKNGRSGALGFIMGLFFTWIALLIYLIIGKSEKLRTKETLEMIKKMKD